MSQGFDITAFIPKFIDENKDRIQKLNQSILTFEKNPSDIELLKEIMRELHTLKGTAKIMGFGDIVTLSHKAEDVFVKIKEGSLQFTKGLFDIVFQALDMLEKMVQAKLKNTTPINVDEICNRLETGSNTTAVQDMKDEPSQPITSLPKEEFKESPPLFSGNIPHSSRGDEEGLKEGISEVTPAPEIKKTIRVGLDKVDILSNYLVELIMARMGVHQRFEDLIKLNRSAKQLREIKTELDANLGVQESDNKKLHEIVTKFNKTERDLLEEISRYSAAYEADIVKLDTITEGIRQQVMAMRMQPVSAVFDLAARLIRDLSRQFNKEVDLVISGAEVELDNTIIEMLRDPLTHLLRNAMDHGIEDPAVRASHGKKKTGSITLNAKQEGGDVLITIKDDGKGIDKELVKEMAIKKGLLNAEIAKGLSDKEIYELIMKPGFSTCKIVTDTSGRGVGMDVVKTVVDRLNGSLIIESINEQGTVFILKVPATIALINVLLIRVGDMTLAIPSTSVEHIAYIFWKDIKTLEGKSSIFIEGQTIPLVRIGNIFMLKRREEKREENVPVILFRSAGKKIGFIVTEVLYEKEIVFREFRGYLKRPRYFSGVTTLGTGEVILIVNMQELTSIKEPAKALPIDEATITVKPEVKKNVILIAEDSMITAELERNILANAGYEADVAADGVDAMEKLHSKKYDLLVTDIDMPRMNGFELTSKVRADKRLKDTPVIIVTSKEQIEDKRRGIEVGADAYILKKEFDQSSLLNTIKRLIGE